LAPRTDVEVCRDVESAREAAGAHGRDIFVIGGEAVYRAALPLADKLYVSYIKQDYPGDVFFPPYDESAWSVEQREDHDEYEWVVYRRI